MPFIHTFPPSIPPRHVTEAIVMSNLVILSIFVTNICVISCTFLAAENNFHKSQLERNNIVNKGVWIKNNPKDIFERTSSDFIFRPNSLDVDNLLQNNFDAFADSYMQGAPILSSYVDRVKRFSDKHERKRFVRDSLKSCKGDKSCIMKSLDDKTPFNKSKMISKLKPTTVYNDYPYEVAILLGANNIDDLSANIRKTKDSGDISQVVLPLNGNKDSPQVNIDSLVNTESKVENHIKFNDSDNVNGTPKRRIKNEFESELIKKIEYTEEIDKIVGNSSNNKVDRNVFDKEERIWYQNSPLMDTNTMSYNVGTQKINRPVNERGLIKVLSMLTKTFKKIMKQHSEIKKIHNKLHVLNEEVTKNVADITKKFTDIEQKYSHIVEVSGKIKDVESKLNLKKEYFEAKDREMSKNLLEFENQQKKFLTQQRQFYNIQKLMLAQNEKINIKQSLIAKTQSEISHKQNNFARILKKAKQIFIDNKHSNLNRIRPSTPRPQPITAPATEESSKLTHTTTQTPYTTESIKINLFAIPTLNKLMNQDRLILKEKDRQNVDALVYKYYFNNTFIDNLMKSKVLNSFMNSPDNTGFIRNEKSKRNAEIADTTILLPVSKEALDGTLNREKRWIRHAQKSKQKRKLRGKSSVAILDVNDEKPLPNTGVNGISAPVVSVVTKLVPLKNKNDPFVVMANTFCKEIGQNTNAQVLNWCVEKALRRLQFLGPQVPIAAPAPAFTTAKQPTTILSPVSVPNMIVPHNVMPKYNVRALNAASPTTLSTSAQTTSSLATQAPAETTTNIYFPDNDELELNLKQYELKKDNEGTVYYDGSVHTSDMVPDSGGFSDIIPGLESNSRVEMDPLTFDLRAFRRGDPFGRLSDMKNIPFG